MANTLNITEAALADLADATHAVNTGDNWDTKKVVRATDHADNDAAEVGDDTWKMALFECKARGKPWIKCDNTLERIIHEGDGATAVPVKANIVFPNWDYATFQ